MKILKLVDWREDGKIVGEDGLDGSDNEGPHQIEAKYVQIVVFRVDGEEDPQ